MLFFYEDAAPERPFRALPGAKKLQGVPPASLVPASEPEEGHAFRSAIAALGKLVPFSGVCLHAHCHGALFFSLDRLLHVRVSFTKARPCAPSCPYSVAYATHAAPCLSSAPRSRHTSRPT